MRPGFVLEVDERTPPLLVHRGEGMSLERFPLGTRVVYPPEPLPGLPDVRAAIATALEQPMDSEPLRVRLRPGMRLTIEQAMRLWDLDRPTCQSLLSSLVEADFLERDLNGRYRKAHPGY